MTGILHPSIDQMHQHLKFLFSNLPENLQRSSIEIAFTGRKETDRGPRYAQHFPSSAIEKAVAFAAQMNTEERNIYLGAGLRKPDLGKKRSNREDVIALTALYVDIDDKDANQNATEKYKDHPPTATVITGRTPHLRQQLWWKLNEPLRDLVMASQYLQGFARTFGGDPAITSAVGLMRLGGSVAWPRKTRRVAEMTEFSLDGGKNV